MCCNSGLTFADERVWRNSDGKEIFASYEGYDETAEAVILKKGSKTYRVPFKSLSEKCQDFVNGKIVDAAVASSAAPKSASSTDLEAEAKKRVVAMQASEIFRVAMYNTQFSSTQCKAIGLRSKLPSVFFIKGDIRNLKRGKDRATLKATLKLIEFVNASRSGLGRYRMPVFEASNIRAAPPREIRNAMKGL